MPPPIFERTSIDDRRVATDGGAVYEDDDDTTFTTYTSDEYHYRLEYLAGWAVETDPPGGMFFSARNGGASAFVFVDVETEFGTSLPEYAGDFFAELTTDEYIHDLERQEEQATTLSSGQSGSVIEFTYTDDTPCEQWCCMYLFVIAGGTGYTIGVEWEATEQFEASATRIIDSFTLVGNTHEQSDADDHRGTADSRSATQRTEDDQ